MSPGDAWQVLLARDLAAPLWVRTGGHIPSTLPQVRCISWRKDDPDTSGPHSGAFAMMPSAGLSSLNGSNDSIVTPILQIRRLKQGKAKYIHQPKLP